jgi:hypothetical protein
MEKNHCNLALRWTFSIALASISVWKFMEIMNINRKRLLMRFKKDKCEKNNSLHHGFAGLIGNTPLIEIKSLSDATGCKILVRKQ